MAVMLSKYIFTLGEFSHNHAASLCHELTSFPEYPVARLRYGKRMQSPSTCHAQNHHSWNWVKYSSQTWKVHELDVI